MKNTQIDILDDLILEEIVQEQVDATQPESREAIFTEASAKNTYQASEVLANIDREVEREVPQVIDGLKKAFEAVKLVFHFSLTSSLIFAALLLVSNYKAYYVLAANYLNPEALENNKKEILTSVLATSITAKKSETAPDIHTTSTTDDTLYGTQHSIKRLVAKSNKSDTPLDIEITPFENRIVIPKLGKNIPMVDVAKKRITDPSELQDIFMKELEKGVVRYPGSAKPGNNGTTFLFGHSSNFPWVPGEYNDVFALLDKVVFDDTIIVYYDQKKYVYKIREKQVIRPGDVSVLKRDNKKNEISLMTCWPIGTTLKRLVVTGELIESSFDVPKKEDKDVKMAFNK